MGNGERVKVAVVGVGHLGKNHARVLRELPQAELVAVVDNNEKTAQGIAERFHTEALTDYKALKGRVDAATVVVPTRHHHSVASWLIENGIHVLVEKPMAFTVEECRSLIELARKHNRILQVGHIERFNPALTSIRNAIDTTAFIEADRLSPYPFRSTDVGVVMDVMIHDLDIILSIVQSEVEDIQAVATPVLSKKHEDIASARITFKNGAVANITASRISDKSVRKMRIFCADRYLNLDFAAKQAWIYSKTPKLDQADFAVENVDISKIDDLMQFVFNDLIRVEQVVIGEEEPLKAEIKHFLRSVQTGERPQVGGEEGMAAIQLAHDILKAARDHYTRHVPEEHRRW
ncbi:MAG: Gfo/Idh/MocA family oxidoreductase [Planctomycetes bacterium]|nr:Gfo/Idh/MocA family oxidoreductase [Planctomycetota bacterium]